MTAGGAHHGPALGKAAAVITIVKAMIGAGCLELPYANSKSGLALGIPGTCVIAFLTGFGIWRLVETKIFLASGAAKGGGMRPHEHVNDFGLGPAAMVANVTLGMPGVVLAGISIITAQLGTVICYVDVMMKTMGGLLDVSDTVLRLALIPTLAVLCLVRQLGELAVLSFIALGVYIYILYIQLKWGVAEISSDGFDSTGRFDVHWDGVGMLFGSTVFAFEGINVAQYVYDAMRVEDPTPFVQVLFISYIITCAVYVYIGAFGFYTYGGSISELVYLNFPQGSPDVEVVQWVLMCILLLSFVLQLYPVFSWAESTFLDIHDLDEPIEAGFDIVEDGEREDASEDDSELSSDEEDACHRCAGCMGPAVVRWLIMLSTFVVAAMVPDIAVVINASGQFSLGFIGFILPPIFHWKAFGWDISPLAHVGNAVLLLAGIFSWSLGIYRMLG